MRLPVSDDDVLLIIDVQNDFCPGGALAVPEGDVVVPVINRLAERFEHVVLTQDWHPPSHSSFATSHPGSAAFIRSAWPTVSKPFGPITACKQRPGRRFTRNCAPTGPSW